MCALEAWSIVQHFVLATIINVDLDDKRKCLGAPSTTCLEVVLVGWYSEMNVSGSLRNWSLKAMVDLRPFTPLVG